MTGFANPVSGLRFLVSILVALFLASLAVDAAAQQQVSIDCGNPFDNGQTGPYDYENPADRLGGIATVETNHFRPEVENLVKGQSTAYIMGDLDFILRAVPNHHRALASLLRYAPRRLPQERMFLATECYFKRAIVFRPEDAAAQLLYGVYLAKNGKISEAKERYLTALRLRPNYAEAHYNLGLAYVKQQEYELAVESATKAEELGYPLPGLRRQIERAGAWPNE